MNVAEKFSNSIVDILFSYDLCKTKDLPLCIDRKEKGLYGKIENGFFIPSETGPFKDVDITNSCVLDELIAFLEENAKSKK